MIRPTPPAERDTPQNWEHLADRVAPRFSRHDGLDVLAAQEEARLDADAEHVRRRRDALDALIDRKRGLLVRAFSAESGEAWEALIGGLAIAVWNEARALSQQHVNASSINPDENEEAALARNRRKTGAPFKNLEEALMFLAYGVPPDADAPCRGPIGLGPISLVCAEDKPEDLRARARMKNAGRPVRAGFLPIEFMPVHATRSSSAKAKGVAVVELADDVRSAVVAAGMGANVAGSQELLDLVDMHVGRWVSPTRKARVGQERTPLSSFIETPTGRSGRGATQQVLTLFSARELAAARGEDVDAFKGRLGASRKALCRELEKRGLIPGLRDEEPGMPKRERRRPPAAARAPEMAFMPGWA